MEQDDGLIGKQMAEYIWAGLAPLLVPAEWSDEARSAYLSGMEVGMLVTLRSQQAGLGLAAIMNLVIHNNNNAAYNAAGEVIGMAEKLRAEAETLYATPDDEIAHD